MLLVIVTLLLAGRSAGMLHTNEASWSLLSALHTSDNPSEAVKVDLRVVPSGAIACCSQQAHLQWLLPNTTTSTLWHGIPWILPFCAAKLGGLSVNVVMVADPGTFSGSPEAMHYLSNLRNAKDNPPGSTVCAKRTTGTLLGQHTVVIATGIGPVDAALCTLELLVCGRWIKEIVYVGTSGWSPQSGGVISIDPYPGQTTGCGAPNPLVKPNRVGDMCVSPLAVNWACKKADYLQQCQGRTTLCTLPDQVSGPSEAQLYGQCEFTSHFAGQQALVAELQDATQAAIDEGAMPTRDATTAAWERSYWTGMANGTGVRYDYDAAQPPMLYGERQCAEVDAQFFYTGPPFEMQARAYVAGTINAAYGNDTVNMNEVIAVSAMEAIGLDATMEKYNALDGVNPIPYVNVRAMSNQLHGPLVRKGGDWVYGTPIKEDYVSGYKYAIATSSTGVLNMYKRRCVAKHGSIDLCDFSVKYP